MRIYSFISFLLVASLLLATPSLGQTIRQRSTTQGFNVGLQGNILSWSSDYFKFLDERSGSGSGFGARVGYGVTQRLEAFGQYDVSFMDLEQLDAQAFKINSLTGGLRFNFRSTTRPFRPYVELGYVRRTGKLDQIATDEGYDNITFKGGALHVGGGFNYFVALPVALNLNASFQGSGKSAIQVNGLNTNEQADITSFRLSLGVVLFLSEL